MRGGYILLAKMTMSKAEPTAPKQQIGVPFQPGQSGNPAGRPKGSRNKLGEAFTQALYDDFQTNGVAAIQAVREEKPDQYLKVIASLMPKQLEIDTGAFDGISNEQLAALVAAATAALGIAPGRDEGTGETAH